MSTETKAPKNIKVTTGAKSIKIENKLNGSVLEITLGEKNKPEVVLVGATPKDKQYGTYMKKFITEMVTKNFPKSLSYKDRFKHIGTVVNKLESVNNFRTLSNNLRKSYDNGKYFPLNAYFYEGNLNQPKDKN